jgi:hypothetical protein
MFGDDSPCLVGNPNTEAGLLNFYLGDWRVHRFSLTLSTIAGRMEFQPRK